MESVQAHLIKEAKLQVEQKEEFEKALQVSHQAADGVMCCALMVGEIRRSAWTITYPGGSCDRRISIGLRGRRGRR